MFGHVALILGSCEWASGDFDDCLARDCLIDTHPFQCDDDAVVCSPFVTFIPHLSFG